jgi:uncharacterized repeat protein (TIGR03806 family)
MGRRKVWGVAGTRLWLLGALGCGSTVDGGVLYEPWFEGAEPRQPAFLAFSSDYAGGGVGPLEAEGFPKLLSQTGAFVDAAALEPVSGILPYEIQSPLWSDGAFKQRWVSVPADTVIGYSETEHLRLPPGTVFVKHFEMALDERFPEQRRRLETRFWVTVSAEAQYGVTYKWNEEQTDAALLTERDVEQLDIIGADGEVRTQPYTYPGPGDCSSCHNAQSGFVLGARAAQLNRAVGYQRDRPEVNQLVAWSTFGLLDARLDTSASLRVPQLVPVADEAAPLEERVRSYWDGNCSMCHAGADGIVPGWDARYATPFAEQGLERPPRNTSLPASRLIAPGEPEDSFIYLRGDTTELGLLMPPVGRNRVDEVYVDVLARWIASLGEAP